MKKVQNLQDDNRWGKIRIILPLLGSILLMGCQNSNGWSETENEAVATAPSTIAAPSSTADAQVSEPVEPASSSAERGRIGLCQSELASLQRINAKAYADQKASFDNLIRSASVYTAVRGDVSAQTKDTMDSLYKYKTNQTCSEIERAVMDGLIRRGESVK